MFRWRWSWKHGTRRTRQTQNQQWWVVARMKALKTKALKQQVMGKVDAIIHWNTDILDSLPQHVQRALVKSHQQLFFYGPLVLSESFVTGQHSSPVALWASDWLTLSDSLSLNTHSFPPWIVAVCPREPCPVSSTARYDCKLIFDWKSRNGTCKNVLTWGQPLHHCHCLV